MEKKQYIKPAVAAMAVATMGPIAGSGEYISYEDWTDADGNNDKPDKELWGGGSSDSSDDGNYWIGE